MNVIFDTVDKLKNKTLRNCFCRLTLAKKENKKSKRKEEKPITTDLKMEEMKNKILALETVYDKFYGDFNKFLSK